VRKCSAIQVAVKLLTCSWDLLCEASHAACVRSDCNESRTSSTYHSVQVIRGFCHAAHRASGTSIFSSGSKVRFHESLVTSKSQMWRRSRPAKVSHSPIVPNTKVLFWPASRFRPVTWPWDVVVIARIRTQHSCWNRSTCESWSLSLGHET
jgi:hypothetical protein